MDLPAPIWDAYVTVQEKKVYVAGGGSPVDEVYDQTFVYDISTNKWDRLPPSGHYYGIPHIIGGKLVIIGGVLSATGEYTNKVSTFDETSQIWTSYYPNLLEERCRPGIATYFEHVIVTGGEIDDASHGGIEVFNWIENSKWRKSSINLPVLMWNFTPIITDGHFLIVGYSSANLKSIKKAYMIPVTAIIRSDVKQQANDTTTEWITMTSAAHFYTALISNSSPPVVVGGLNAGGTPTSDIKMYDESSTSWRKIASLSSARSEVAVAAVNNNAIVVIGGCTKGDTVTNAKSSSLTKVELGQATLTKPVLLTF